VLPALVVLCVLAGTGAARTAQAGGALAGKVGARLPRLSAAVRLSGAAASLALVALLLVPLLDGRVGRLEFEAREVGRRMELQRGLARAVEAAGGREALRPLGSATTNRALHTRLAWELGYAIEKIERGYGHPVVLRTSDETLAGSVPVWGTPGERRVLARAGSFEVYRRLGVSYTLFTSSLQGIDIRGGMRRMARAG
jgi:hypothetical protein